MKAEIKKEINGLIMSLEKLKSLKQGSSPEARKIRTRLRNLGKFVSGNDVREGKPKEARLEELKSKVKKQLKEKKTKTKKKVKK